MLLSMLQHYEQLLVEVNQGNVGLSIAQEFCQLFHHLYFYSKNRNSCPECMEFAQKALTTQVCILLIFLNNPMLFKNLHDLEAPYLLKISLIENVGSILFEEIFSSLNTEVNKLAYSTVLFYVMALSYQNKYLLGPISVTQKEILEFLNTVANREKPFLEKTRLEKNHLIKQRKSEIDPAVHFYLLGKLHELRTIEEIVINLTRQVRDEHLAYFRVDDGQMFTLPNAPYLPPLGRSSSASSLDSDFFINEANEDDTAQPIDPGLLNFLKLPTDADYLEFLALYCTH